VVVVLAPRTSDLETWGDADVVRDVRDVLADTGVRCMEVVVDSPTSVDALAPPNLLAFPNARHFHGADGSCGSIPGLLKARGIPFLGSDAEGHAARSKTHMKAVLARHGLPTPHWALIMEDTLEGDVSELRFPLIVKPDDSSESVGVVRVDDLAMLRQLRLSGDGPTIAEEWVRAREFTVAVIGNDVQRRAFPLEVVVPEQDRFLTAEIKQHTLAGTTTPVVDVVLSERLEDLAIAVAAALRIDDWCRVDILKDADGNLYVIDVNTLPGLRRQRKRVSYFPLCLQYAYSAGFADTILALVAVGLLRHGIALPPAVQAAHTKMLSAQRGHVP
jgi:D-alanine-D-alanine ligase